MSFSSETSAKNGDNRVEWTANKNRDRQRSLRGRRACSLHIFPENLADEPASPAISHTEAIILNSNGQIVRGPFGSYITTDSEFKIMPMQEAEVGYLAP